jgi:hypothetical protein
MIDKTVAVSGWAAGWISRTSPAFLYYSNLTSYILSLCICVLGIRGFISVRRDGKQLSKCDGVERAVIEKQINKRILKISRGHWCIAVLYLLNAIAISGVDAVIGVMAIKEDVSKDPQSYDQALIVQIVVYCVWITVLFVSTFVIVPMMQMLFVTAVLARFMRKNGVTSLSAYMPEARLYSTHIAQVWAMITFFVMAWWQPSVSRCDSKV